MRLPDPPLLIITDRSQARASLDDVVAAACAGGCRWISLREKDLTPDEQIRLAEILRPIAHRHRARLTLHGSPEIAAAGRFDGVHLPAGTDWRSARSLLGPEALIGISIHSAAELVGITDDVDYVIAGPAFATASKPGYGPALGAAGVQGLAAATDRPCVALGGITPFNLGTMMRAGAAGVAVMGGIMRAADPEQETRHYLAALRNIR